MSNTRVDAKGERGGGGGGNRVVQVGVVRYADNQENWDEKKSIVGSATNSFTFVLSSSFNFDVLAVST